MGTSRAGGARERRATRARAGEQIEMSLSAEACASVLEGEVASGSVNKLCKQLASLVGEETAFATFHTSSDWVWRRREEGGGGKLRGREGGRMERLVKKGLARRSCAGRDDGCGCE